MGFCHRQNPKKTLRLRVFAVKNQSYALDSHHYSIHENHQNRQTLHQAPPKLRKPLMLAARQRLYYENQDLEHFSFFLLHEALQRMQRVSQNTIQFRLSEFFILLTPQTMQYLDKPTQILIRDATEERSKGTRIDISKMDDPEQVATLRAFSWIPDLQNFRNFVDLLALLERLISSFDCSQKPRFWRTLAVPPPKVFEKMK